MKSEKGRKQVMKELNLIIGKIALIGLLAVLPIAIGAVEFKNTYHPVGYDQQQARVYTEAPAAVFQSTSTLAGSGSAWSATPMLGEDGMAMLEGASEDPKHAQGGIRRIVTPSNSGIQQPLGDALLPLFLLALAYAGYKVLARRKKSAQRE